MNLVAFTTDARPYRGYLTQYINPDEVSSVERNNSVDNPTEIKMRNGDVYHVKGWPDEAALKLQAAKETKQ